MQNKPPVGTQVVDANGFITVPWSLFFQGLATGDPGTLWTPVFSGLTGTPTISGKWYQIGQYKAFFEATINGTSSTTAGTAYISNFPDTINADTVILAANSTTNIGIGTGIARATNQRIYVPTWNVVTNIVTISGVIETI